MSSVSTRGQIRSLRFHLNIAFYIVFYNLLLLNHTDFGVPLAVS